MQRYPDAIAHLTRGLDATAAATPATDFTRRRQALYLIDRGRAKHRAGLPGAEEDTRTGLKLIAQLAAEPKPPADLLAAAAAAHLTAEPVSFRSRARATEFARQAVSITAGQIAPFLVTLAHATGNPADVAAAARTASQQGEIVKPLVPPAALAAFEQRQAKLAIASAGLPR